MSEPPLPLADALLDAVKALVTDDGARQFFAERALWFAGFSQQATAIPWLVLTASLALLAVIAWIAFATWITRSVVRWLRRMRGYA